jgi:archaellum biogenesis ATPase FlaH
MQKNIKNILELEPLKVNGDDVDDKTKHLPFPHPFRMIICGSSGSGKTFLMMQFLLNSKWFFLPNGKSFWNKIYVLTPTSLSDPIYRNLNDPRIKDRVFLTDELNEDLLNQLLDSKEKQSSIVVIDDFSAVLKNSERTISNFFFRCRHSNISIILLGQAYKSFSKNCRINTTDCFIFSFNNKKEMKIIAEEQSSKNLMDSDFVDALEKVTSEKYGFLYRDRKSNYYNKNFELLNKNI